MNTPKLNLHIHSKFSDGHNSIKAIVYEAMRLKMKYICITDHFSNSWKANVIPTLNSVNKINLYLNQIDECQQYIFKNDVDMVLLKGIEVDLSSSKSYIIQTLNPWHFDLLLFEYLESYDGIYFIQSIIDYWKETKQKLPLLGLAHFDPTNFLFGDLNPLINFLKRNSIIFEFNTSYSQFYSMKNKDFFQKLKEHEILVSIGCDSHSLHNIAAIEEAYEMIQYYGLERNLLSLVKKLKTLKKEV